MPDSPRQSHGWIGVAIAALAAAAYLPALTSGFNADDYLILWRIKSIAASSDPFGYFKFAFYDYFRPLGFLSYALDWRVWHLNAFGFHLTNVLLHTVNSWLVFALLRRLVATRDAAWGAALFALHPASHEVVYWIAARFDLLATFFTLLALVLRLRSGVAWSIAATAAFALALLSKESAISLLIIAPAWDVLIARRRLQETVRRLAPLLAVVVLYAIARTFGADLAAAGGARRLPKLVMTFGGIAVVLWLSLKSAGDTQSSPAKTHGALSIAAFVAVFGAALAGLATPVLTGWISEKLGFVGHVAFYSASPVVVPAPDPTWFAPDGLSSAWPLALLLAAASAAALSVWRSGVAIRDHYRFVLLFIAAALLPVSSMTGGLRYLYLPSIGVCMLAAVLISRLSRRARTPMVAAIVVCLAISAQQIVLAGRAWQTASSVTRDGVTLMAGSIRQCGIDDVLLLTTPVAIGDVYANLSWDAFDVLTGCAPRSFMTLLRVVRSDLRATVETSGPGLVVLRVPNYSGNIVASEDLRSFTKPIAPGQQSTIQTEAGRLEIFPEGTTQVFRLAMTPQAQAAPRFYYSDGRIRRQPN